MKTEEFLLQLNNIRQKSECMSEKPDYSFIHGIRSGDLFKPIRSYTASILLYPDCDEHYKAMQDIINKSYNYCGILHDRDKKVNEENLLDIELNDFDNLELSIPVDEDKLSIKKKHCHFVLNYVDARTNTAVAKELGISSRFVLMFSNLKSTLLYLIHRDYQDKYQYSYSDTIGTLSYKLQSYAALYDRDDSEVLHEILTCIKYFPCDEYIDVTDFALDILNKGYSPHVQQKYFYLINNCINHHNKRVEYFIDRNKNKKGKE